jgi:hypothetical protein
VSGATVATAGTVITILTDMSDWREPVTRAARLAAATGRKLRVVVADGGELLAAASLACAHLMAPGGLVSRFEPREARRLLKAQSARLRLELQRLAQRHGIEAELIEPEAVPPPGLWAGGTALTVFGRRRRGVILVVHAGSMATLEIAARLAAEGRQKVRLLKTGPGPAGEAAVAERISRLIGPWLEEPTAGLGADAPLARSADERIATLVLDPAYVEARQLQLDALLREIRRLMQGA